MTPLQGLMLIAPTAVAGIAVVAYAAYAAMGRRPMITPVLAITGFILGIGAIVSWIEASSALEAVAAAGPDGPALAIDSVATHEAWSAGGHWGAALVLLMAAWGSALGSLPGANITTRVWTVPAGLGATALLAVGLVAGLAVAAWSDAPRLVYGALGVMWLAGLPLSVVSIRRGSGEAARRLGAVRLVTAGAALLAVVQAWRGVTAGIAASSFTAMSLGPADVAVWGAAADMHAAADSITWLTVLVVATAGLVVLADDARSILVQTTLVDLAASLGVIVALGAVRTLEHTRVDALLYAARGGPVAGLMADPATTLPSGRIGDVRLEAMATRYGDVVVFDGLTWHREASFVEGLWEPDRVALADLEIISGDPLPLFVARATSPATALVEGLPKAADQTGLLLTRTAENPSRRMDAEPALLGLAAVVPVRLAAAPVDLDTVVWAAAATKRPYRGALWWYGPGSEDEDAVRRVRSAMAATDSRVLVVAIGKGDTVKDVVQLCLAATKDESGASTDRECRLLAMSEDEMLADARIRWTAPEARARVTTDRVDEQALEVVRRIGIEGPALDACATTAAGGEIGQVGLEIGISFQGEVGDVRSTEATGLSASTVDCVLARLRVMRFAGAVKDSLRMPLQVSFPDPLAPEPVAVEGEPAAGGPAGGAATKAAAAPAVAPEVKVYRSQGRPAEDGGGG